jgi:hypothetical protein
VLWGLALESGVFRLSADAGQTNNAKAAKVKKRGYLMVILTNERMLQEFRARLTNHYCGEPRGKLQRSHGQRGD